MRRRSATAAALAALASLAAAQTPTLTPSVSPTPFEYCVSRAVLNSEGGPVLSGARLLGRAGSWSADAGNASVAVLLESATWEGNACGAEGLETPWYAYSGLLAVAIDVDPSRDAFYDGGTLTVDTCCSSVDTVLFIGSGCPLDYPAFGCAASSDDDGALQCNAAPLTHTCAPGVAEPGVAVDAAGHPTGFGFSRVSMALTQPVAYVLVAGYAGATGRLVLNWAFTPPTPTPSPTRGGSATRSAAATPTASVSALSGSASARPTGTATGTGSPPPSRRCATGAAVQLAVTGTGVAGVVTGSTAAGSDWARGGAAFAGVACPLLSDAPDAATTPAINVTVPVGRKALVALDLGDDVALGGTLTLQTCINPAFDTFLAVSFDCPAVALRAAPGGGVGSAAEVYAPLPGWACAGASDVSDACGQLAGLALTGVSARTVYVLVAGSGGSSGPFSLAWSYDPDATGPAVDGGNVSTIVTPAVQQPRTPSRTFTLGAGLSPSGTAQPSSSVTPTKTGAGTPAGTPSRAATPTGTPSGTLSPGVCGLPGVGTALTATLSGRNGSFAGSTGGASAARAAQLFANGVCGALDGAPGFSFPAQVAGLVGDAAGDVFNAVYPGPQALFAIDVGTPLVPGQALYVDTCHPRTAFDTLLYVGGSCPLAGLGFEALSCAASNDDGCPPSTTASGNVTGATDRASLALLPLPGVRVYYVLLGGYEGSSGAYALNWRVGLPHSPTPTATPSASASASFGARASASPPATATPSRTPVGSVSASPSPSGGHARLFGNASVLVLRVGGGAGPGGVVPGGGPVQCPGGASTAPSSSSSYYYVEGRAAHVWLDEVAGGPAATAANQSAPLRTVALPSAPSLGGAACTLAAGSVSRSWLYDQEGLPQLTADGRAVVLPCYSTPPGDSLSPGDDKVVAFVHPDGTVDTGTLVRGSFDGAPSSAFPQALRCAAAVNASFSARGAAGAAAVWLSGGGGSPLTHGVFSTTGGDAGPAGLVLGGDAGVVGYADARCVAAVNVGGTVRLWGTASPADGASWAGVFELTDASPGGGGAGGLPTGRVNASAPTVSAWCPAGGTCRGSATGPRVRALPLDAGGVSLQPHALSLENAGSLWLASDHARAGGGGAGQVLHLTLSLAGAPSIAAGVGSPGRWVRVPADDLTVDASQPVYSLAGRNEVGVAGWVLYAATRTTLWRVPVATRQRTALYSVTDGCSVLRGVVLPPVAAGWAPATATSTPTRSRTGPTSSGASTPTPAATLSPPATVNAFRYGSNILLLRAGGVSSSGALAGLHALEYAAAEYAPLFLDELSGDAPSVVVRSLPLPTAPAANVSVGAPGAAPQQQLYRCTLAAGWPGEGGLALSGDERTLYVPCHDRPPRTVHAAGAGKTVATVAWDGSVATAQRLADAFTAGGDTGASFAAALAWDAAPSSPLLLGGRAEESGAATGNAGGLRAAQRGDAFSVPALLSSGAGPLLPASRDVRCLRWYGATLLAATGPADPAGATLVQLGGWDAGQAVGSPALASTLATTTVWPSLSAAMRGWEPTSFVVEPGNASRVWMASGHALLQQRQLFLLAATSSTGGGGGLASPASVWAPAGAWALTPAGGAGGSDGALLPPVVSVTGRLETPPLGGAPMFVLYAATPAAVLRATLGAPPSSSSALSVVVLASAAAYAPAGSAGGVGLPGVVFRGVALPPRDTALPQATAPGTPSNSPTTTRTASGTMSSSSTLTPSASGTGSASRSGTSAPTRTGSGTASPPATASATATRTPSATGTPTRTGTATFSATATRTATRTPPATATATATATGSRSGAPTPSGTASAPAAPSRTVAPSGSGTGTLTPTGTPSGTASGTGSLTQSGTTSTTRTGSDTASPPSTTTGTASGTPPQTLTGTASVTGTPPATATATASGTGSRSPTPTPPSTGTPTGSATWSATSSGSSPPTPPGTPSPTESSTRSRRLFLSPSNTPPPTGTGTSSVTATGTPSSSAAPTTSATPTVSGSRTPAPTGSASATRTPPATGSSSGTGTPSGTATLSATRTPSGTGSRSGTPSASGTGSQTGTGSASGTGTQTGTPSASSTGTQTGTPSASGTRTPSSSETGTPSSSETGTPSSSATASASGTGSGTPMATLTPTGSRSWSATLSGSRSRSGSATGSRGSRSRSATRSRTRSRSATRSRTRKAKR